MKPRERLHLKTASAALASMPRVERPGALAELEAEAARLCKETVAHDAIVALLAVQNVCRAWRESFSGAGTEGQRHKGTKEEP
jgi:hypothetical protein